MSWHQTIIVGNVGRDPELKYLASGVPVCNFTVAVNERWTDSGTNEQKEKTTWYRVACWRKLAETANQYVHKGMQVMVVGNVEARAYTDNSGQPAASLELTARDVRFLGSRAEREGGDSSQYDDTSPPQENMSDIPF